MNCPDEIEIPTPLVEPCENTYLSSSCVFIPEASVALDLPINSTQTQVNNAVANSLIYKEQQIQKLENDIDLLHDSRADIVVEGSLAIDGTGTEDEPFIISTTFDIDNYQLKNIPTETVAASALNEGRIRYRTDTNNSYLDMSMKVGIGAYSWVNIVQNNF